MPFYPIKGGFFKSSIKVSIKILIGFVLTFFVYGCSDPDAAPCHQLNNYSFTQPTLSSWKQSGWGLAWQYDATYCECVTVYGNSQSQILQQTALLEAGNYNLKISVTNNNPDGIAGNGFIDIVVDGVVVHQNVLFKGYQTIDVPLTINETTSAIGLRVQRIGPGSVVKNRSNEVYKLTRPELEKRFKDYILNMAKTDSGLELLIKNSGGLKIVLFIHNFILFNSFGLDIHIVNPADESDIIEFLASVKRKVFESLM